MTDLRFQLTKNIDQMRETLADCIAEGEDKDFTDSIEEFITTLENVVKLIDISDIAIQKLGVFDSFDILKITSLDSIISEYQERRGIVISPELPL